MQSKIILVIIGVILIAIGGSLVYLRLTTPHHTTVTQKGLFTALSLPTQAEVNQSVGSNWQIVGMLIYNDSQSLSQTVKNASEAYIEALKSGNVTVTISEILFNSTHYNFSTHNAIIAKYGNLEIMVTISGNKSAVNLQPFVNLAYSVVKGDNGTVPSIPSFLVFNNLKFVEFAYSIYPNQTGYTVVYRNLSVSNINYSYVEIQVLHSPNASLIYKSQYDSVARYVNQSIYNGAYYFNFSSMYGDIILGFKQDYLIYISASQSYFDLFTQIVNRLPST